MTGTKRMGRDTGECEDSSTASDVSGILHGLTLGHGPQGHPGQSDGPDPATAILEMPFQKH